MSQVASAISQKETDESIAWRYSLAGEHDLRIDFMRDTALVMVVVAHMEVMSIFNIFSWERFGLTTGAEGFVILSGFMLGMLNRVRLQKTVLLTVGWGLYLRAWKTYQVNIIIIVSFLLLRYFLFINALEATHFTDRFSGTNWSPYPLTSQIKETWFNTILYLQIDPHQTQILGFYIFLLLLSPLFLGMLRKDHVYPLLGVSLLIYDCWQRWPVWVTPCELESAFPLLAWQFIFVLGMCCGWHKAELISFARTPPGEVAVAALVFIALILAFVAQNRINPLMPPALLMHVIPPVELNAFYHTWAAKNGLGPVRIFNDISLMVIIYLLLTQCQRPLNWLTGWFPIPLGQRSLYTFILHVYIVFAVSQLVTFDLWYQAWTVNTLIHAAALSVLWLMAKYRVAARQIPN